MNCATTNHVSFEKRKCVEKICVCSEAICRLFVSVLISDRDIELQFLTESNKYMVYYTITLEKIKCLHIPEDI